MLIKAKKFSVLMSIYFRESPVNFRQSLESIVNQTLVPNEIVLIKDGLLTESLEEVLNEYILNFPNLFKIISLPVNKGLGNALSIGVKECSYELVARMDTDDICVLNRFEKQVEFFNNNPNIDLVGTNVEEFNVEPGDLKRFRKMPESGEPLLKYSKFRNPVNHPTVMFRIAKVLEAGNYNGEILLFEDFSLFIRMLQKGASFHNIQENLLHFRTGLGIDVIKRRSGLFYVKNEWKFALLSLKIGNLNFFEWLFYVSTKLPLRLLPSKVILFVYNQFLRH
ncbi:glycosyltransferase [Flavobacterium gawalongense]|uniref:Glycosyltransferase n=1 Tax=Flavobacterium gawalongense TaxID=2594432 RepID=A0A553BYM1_9FLAO|nr:glycosyltransferase [Flavobacterium gawalongense]TRX13397.1 glycosyltransferase [Flavobacterium gawalongense]TRX15673.1 glycosyltransferase [Flavobacterium gawalongense]TRX31511.1 glycosyltransferase [Flavobacterium gawalongense]